MIVECHRCRAWVDGRVLASHQSEHESEPAPFTAWFLECPQCRTPLVAGMYASDEEPYRVWPSPYRSYSMSIPAEIRAALFEGNRCFEAGAFDASAVMAGRALEAVGRHFGAKNLSIGAGIKELKQNGIIDSRLEAWAQELKDSRNLSAHASGHRVSRADAEDLLQFADAICDYVFVLAARFEGFRRRQEARAAEEARRKLRLIENAPEE